MFYIGEGSHPRLFSVIPSGFENPMNFEEVTAFEAGSVNLCRQKNDKKQTTQPIINQQITKLH